MWTHRIILESLKHETSSFLTLTYSDDHLPLDGSLVPKDLQLFIKRLRTSIAPAKIRFYAVGEYGDQSFRPHYHLALFGLGPSHADLVQSCWPYGFTYTGSLTLESAQYVAGYVVKKMTKPDDPRLNGRYPEFARMSLRPGIGAGALDELTDFFKTDLGVSLLNRTGDVPLSLRHGGKDLPLGRYLRSKLREKLQIASKGTSDPYFQQQLAEMSALFNASEARSKWQKLQVYTKANKPKIRAHEGRHKIFNGRNKKL